MKKNLLIGTLALLIGVLIGKSFESAKELETKEIVIEKLVTVPAVITKSVVNNTCEPRGDLLEAQILYGKAFSLFLATLGVKLNVDKKDELRQLLENPKSYAVSQKNDDTEVIIPRELDFTPTTWFKEFVSKEKAELKSIDDDALLQDVQKFMLKDPELFFARSKYIKAFPEIKKMLGEYKAKLYLITGKNKGKIDDVSLVMDFEVKGEDSINGRFELKLSRDGKVYSNSAGNGGNGNIRMKEGSILIEAGPGRFFHFLKDSLSVANCYENGKLSGIARFKKID